MISALIGKRLCRRGRHSVKLWDYRRDGDCVQFGICKRCNTQRWRIEHDYPKKEAWETNHCNRCNERRQARRDLNGGLFNNWDGDIGGFGE